MDEVGSTEGERFVVLATDIILIVRSDWETGRKHICCQVKKQQSFDDNLRRPLLFWVLGSMLCGCLFVLLLLNSWIHVLYCINKGKLFTSLLISELLFDSSWLFSFQISSIQWDFKFTFCFVRHFFTYSFIHSLALPSVRKKNKEATVGSIVTQGAVRKRDTAQKVKGKGRYKTWTADAMLKVSFLARNRPCSCFC